MDVGEGDGLVEVEQGADGDLVPGGIFDGVVVDDEVAAVDAGAGGGGVDRDVVVWAGPVMYSWTSLWTMETPVIRPRARRKLAKGPARATRMRCQRGWALKSPGSSLCGFAGHLAGHLDVAAEGKQARAVVGVAAFEAEEAFAEADGEDLDADAAELGDGEVAEFVH